MPTSLMKLRFRNFPKTPEKLMRRTQGIPDYKVRTEYRVLRKGTGAHPTPTKTVKVHYQGWPSNGNVFDSSYNRGQSIFPLSGVIKGWTEGMQLVGQGGMIELEIPPELAYGDRGAGAAVPPKATLHFSFELLGVQ